MDLINGQSDKYHELQKKVMGDSQSKLNLSPLKTLPKLTIT
jgi:hypothetical protein